MGIWFALIAGAYILGAIPVSYLVAKYSRGIDLRKAGTGQAGAGNLWRLTSWRLGLPVGLFDALKGAAMMWVGKAVGLDVAQQLAVGLAAIVGHNWSVFLRIDGGRGVGTTMGVIVLLPIIDPRMTPWIAVTFLVIGIPGTIVLRSSPLPVLVAVASTPVASWLFHEPLPATLAFLSIFVILVIRRLTAPQKAVPVKVSRGARLINRLLFDRDIRDRKAWVYQTVPEDNSKPHRDKDQP